MTTTTTEAPDTPPPVDHQVNGSINIDAEAIKKRNDHLPFRIYGPGEFEPADHYYPRALNSTIHPTVRKFLSLSNKQMIKRYCHTHADINKEPLLRMIEEFKPKQMIWCGVDLMYTNERETGMNTMTVIETNSCPSGQKSSPLYDDNEEEGGYGKLLKHCFLPECERRKEAGILPEGALAVIYDKNLMEASGYADALADITEENVYLIPLWNKDNWGPNDHVQWRDNVLFVRESLEDKDAKWIPLRACFRYVTQKPWTKIPVNLPIDEMATFICNPISACLAGGRNKMVAAKAYDNMNTELALLSLPTIRTPLTIRDVPFEKVRSWIESLGGFGCIKVPYSNAGQGVYTVTNEKDLVEFEQCEKDNPYSLFIIQSLIAHSNWSSKANGAARRATTLYHNGTVPNKKGNIFVADLRLQVCVNSQTGGFTPVAMYARRAKDPLSDTLSPELDTWGQLGTNLSVAQGQGLFSSESGRLLLMDRKDFDSLGLSLDALIDGYIQACLCHIAIDRQADWFHHNGSFDLNFLRSVCNDDRLLEEVAIGAKLLEGGN